MAAVLQAAEGQPWMDVNHHNYVSVTQPLNEEVGRASVSSGNDEAIV